MVLEHGLFSFSSVQILKLILIRKIDAYSNSKNRCDYKFLFQGSKESKGSIADNGVFSLYQ